jgi:hypothetical protein
MTVNYLLILIVLLLFAGLGVDAGMLEWRYLQMSAAARAAATSGVIGLQRYGPGGISPGVLNAASQNGFTNGVNGVTVTAQNPPNYGTYADVTSAVRVTITQSVPTSFMSLVSFPAVTMKARYDQPGITPITPVSLSSVFNVYAVFRDTTTVTNGGFDTSSYAYSANALDSVRTSNNLGALISWRGDIFTLGVPDGKNGASGVTIPLTSGNFSQLLMLASAYDGPVTSSFVVTYSDASTATTSLSLSNWLNSSNNPNEVIVQSTSYRLFSNSGAASGTPMIYGYAINLNNLKTVTSLTLPSTRQVVVFAIDLMP